MIFRIFFDFISKRWQLLYCFFSDYEFYRKHSLEAAVQDEDHSTARIMLVMHQLEKGMSFTKSKRAFGGEKAMNLVTMLNAFISKYGMNDVCKIAINVLYEYLKRDNSTKEPQIRKAIKSICDMHNDVISDNYAGVKVVTEPPVFDKHIIEDFFNTRSSVREYSNAPVTEDEYKKALSFATCTPSACNRQASRVHFFNMKNTIKRLIDNQLGNQGWCDNATACFVVTVNESYFGGGTNGMKLL